MQEVISHISKMSVTYPLAFPCEWPPYARYPPATNVTKLNAASIFTIILF